ncbi:MAG: hypothetical protein JXB48_20260 [Candidatus Latescibacteria bacterium]|nr:hypothetical protein [Candidatus Latescibacterota bacterium]
MEKSGKRLLLCNLYHVLLPVIGIVLGISCGSDVQTYKSPVMLRPNGKKPVIIEKLRVTDSRVVRGFRGTPVDGTLRSIEFRGFISEYPDTLSEGFDASAGVDYDYNDNDGLHISLKDNDGFDAVVIRGGATSRMYSDITSLIEPADTNPVYEFKGGNLAEIVQFGKRIITDKISFFGTRNGTIADLSLFRIDSGSLKNTAAIEHWRPSGSSFAIPKPESEFAPENIYYKLENDSEGNDQQIVILDSGGSKGQPVEAKTQQPIQLLTPMFETEKGLDAVGFDMNIDGPREGFDFIVTLHDPLDPSRDLVWIQFHGSGSGRYSFVLDCPDQVLLTNSRLWLTVTFGCDVTLSGTDGGAPVIDAYIIPRQEALSEAVVYRKFLLKSIFALLSECRPWGSYRNNMTSDEFFSLNKYAALCPELFLTIDICFSLAPDDDIVRQYREWVYLRHLDELSNIDPPPMPPDTVPAWAWYPRLAWLETRKIAEWWIDNRIVPTGEFGGKVSDDSDMYQQFTDLPFFESEGVGAKLKDNAMRLAELTDKKHMRDGINILVCDALHAYEEGINHLALMSRWFYGDPIYLERCMESARNMEKLTILTEDGRRHFRDRSKMGYEDIITPRTPAIDGHATTLLWHTSLQTADYNRNPAALKLVGEWADTWLKFQKPGQWATNIEVLTGRVLDSDKNRPLNGGYGTQASIYIWLYALTGKTRYLEPFMYYYRQNKAPYPASYFLGDVYSLGLLDNLGDSTVNKLASENPALLLYRTGDPTQLTDMAIGKPKATNAQIQSLYDALRWPDMYTTAEQFDDRIFPDITMPASISYLGGFCRRNKFNPTLAVSWEGFGTDYGALVTVNRHNILKAMVYSYSETEMNGQIRVWALEHGRYRITTGTDSDGDTKIEGTAFTRTIELKKADRIKLTLPPKAVTIVEIQQIEKLEPIFTCADLAITAREIKLTDSAVTGILHNIGSTNAEKIVAAIVDDKGDLITRKIIDSIEAPIDLVPRRLNFSIQLPGKSQDTWKLVIDPENAIPEIYEGNNTVSFNELPAVDYAKGFE